MKNASVAAKGHILAIGTIAVWGSTFIFSKILLTTFQPMQIMVMRFVLAYIVLWCLYPKVEKTTPKDELGIFGMAVFGSTIYFLCENNALRFTLASNVSILVASAPIWTALFAHFLLPNSRLRRNILYGFLVAFVGVALVVFNGAVVLKFNPLGDLLSIGAALSWAVYSMLVTRYIDKFSSFFLMRKMSFYGLISTLPLLLIDGTPMPWAALREPRMFMSILFLGIIGSGIAYVTWNMATRILGVVRVSNYIYANPFVTLVTAAIFLGEPITVMGVAGAVLIILGVVLGVRQKKADYADNTKLPHNTNIEIRKAVLSDVADVAKIYSDIHSAEEHSILTVGWDRAIYPTEATARDAVSRGDLFVMTDCGSTIAAAIINTVQDPAYASARWQYDAPESEIMVLHTLVVSPDAARKGYGRAFVAFYENYALDNGRRYLRMDTNERNTAARAMYKSLNYREADVVPCTFHGLSAIRLVCLEKKLG